MDEVKSSTYYDAASKAMYKKNEVFVYIIPYRSVVRLDKRSTASDYDSFVPGVLRSSSYDKPIFASLPP